MDSPTIMPTPERESRHVGFTEADIADRERAGRTRRRRLHFFLLASHRRDGLWVFAVMYAILATWSVRFGLVPLLYDSGGYWSGQAFLKASGEFSLAAWPAQMRGYFVPLLSYLNREFADLAGVLQDTPMKLLLAALFAWSAAIVAPRFFEVALGWRVPLLGRVAFAGFVFAFWHWYVLWPLVDFFSLTFSMWGLMHLLLAARATVGLASVHSVVGGFALAAAANARPVYSIVFYAASVGVLVAVARRRDFAATAGLVAFAVGALVVLAPQAYINDANDRPLNPFNFPHDSIDYDLYTVTLDNGFRFPQYQVNVGDPDFPIGGVKSPDPKGDLLYARLREQCCADGRQFFSYGQYMAFVLQNPTGMGGMYLRHLINGVDTWWPSPYTDDIMGVSSAYRVANYAIWFAFLGALVTAARSRAWRGRRATAAGLGAVGIVLLAPTLLVIPGGVETRYYLPLFYLCYAVVAFRVLPVILRPAWWTHNRLWLLPAFAVFAWLWLDMSDAVLANMGPRR